MRQIKSPLDSRFGAKNITAPTSGAYGSPFASPYAPPPTKPERQSERKSILQKSRFIFFDEQPPCGETPTTGSRLPISRPFPSPTSSWTLAPSQRSNNPPPYSGPPQHTVPDPAAESPRTSIESGNSVRMSTYSYPSTQQLNAQSSPSIVPLYPSKSPSPGNYNPPPPPNPLASNPRGFSPLPLRSAEASPRMNGERSKITIPSPPLPRVQTQLPPRSLSRMGSSTKRTTSRVGIGFANASKVSPIEQKGSLGASRGRMVDATPESAESPEQWPGAY